MKRVRIVRRAKEDIERLMLDVEQLESEAKALKTRADVAREQIKADMLKNGIDEYVVDDDPNNLKVLKATAYVSSRVNYDLQAIKEKLPKEKLKLVSNKVLVAEEHGLRKFIKRHPELRDELKEFVKALTIVDENKLSIALDYGNITLDDISGCYTVSESNVLKIQRVKRFDMVD